MAVTRMGLGRRVIYGAIVVFAIFATLFGLSNGRLFGVTPTAPLTPTGTVPSASANPVDLQPAPSLFKSADLEPVSALLAPQLRRAVTTIDDFYADQPAGGAVDDAAFVAWASKRVLSEPSVTQQRRELALLAEISRSAKRTLAARWLSLHGCRDVWTSYALEQQRFRPDDDQVATTTELDAVLDLAARVTSATQRRLGGAATVQAPCAPRGTLNPADCGCSFPSSAAAASAAARTYLAGVGPIASRQYAWMEQQVDMAAVYQGYELPSDVTAGAFLGYLVGKYFLESHGYAKVDPAAAAAAAAAALR